MSAAPPKTGPVQPRLQGAELARVLLSPHSVAVVGASDDASKTSGRPLTFLRQAGFAGRVYPVNPRRAQVQGETAWPDLASLPEVPEHVFVITPTDTVIDTVRECARLGVRLVTVLASGFSEAGAEGLAREQALRDICRERSVAIMLITHDMGVIAALAQRVAVMYAGRIVETGPRVDVLGNPQHPYTRGLMAAIPQIGVRRRRLAQISGSMPRPDSLPPGCAFAPRCIVRIKVCDERHPDLSSHKDALMAIHSHAAACFNVAGERTQ